ncbi:hypothetical protein WA026_003248 [Henosepilachna vigintioctopunctata]
MNELAESNSPYGDHTMERRKKAEQAINFFNSSRSCLSSLLKLLEDNKDQHEDLQALLEEYNKIRETYSNKYERNGRRFPLIVLEGLDGSGKSTVGMRLAKKLGAERISTPPKSLSTFRSKFDGHFCLHAPFYYLGNYAAALEVDEILQKKPVVMDRFWHSTTAFALAQMKEDYFDVLKSTELPDKSSDVYKWPNDLLKPDIVLFLDVSEEVRNNRLSRRKTKTEQENLLSSKEKFRKNVLLTYDNMSDPGIEKINGNEDFPVVLQEIDNKIKHLF